MANLWSPTSHTVVLPFAVEPADKGQDRHIAQPADLKELAGLLFDALLVPLAAASTITSLSTAVSVRQVSSLKSQWAEILVARRVQ